VLRIISFWLGGSKDVLGSTLDWGLLDVGSGLFVLFHELGEIELWCLKDLDLSDHAVFLEWENLGALSLDLLANFFFHAINIINFY
jgi:hypothetical protein